MAAKDDGLRDPADSGPGTRSEDPRRLQLVSAFEDGVSVILGQQPPDWTPQDEDRSPTELVITGDTIRQVLLDRDVAAHMDPRGVTIQGAVIAGQLDLDHTSIGYPLRFRSCRFTGSLTAEQATLRSLDLSGSHLHGAIRLSGAHIAGQLNMSGATLYGTLYGTEGNSLVADNLQADNNVFLDEVTATADAGAIRLLGAHIAGQLTMRGATLYGADSDGDSLVADTLQADQTVFLDQGFTASGAIRLSGAHIAGQLTMSVATLHGTDTNGNSLVADTLQADQFVFLDQGFTAFGAIALFGAEIGNLVVGDEPSSLPRLGAVTGWRIRDLQGAIRTDRRAAANWLDTQRAAQPWQEVAAIYERIGQPSDARWMRYRSAVRSTGTTKGPTWLARQSYRWTTGNGYYPLAALFWLAVIFGVA